MAQGHDLGQRPVDSVHHNALGRGIDTLSLLAISVEDYFRLRGYRRLDRTEVPAHIQITTVRQTVWGECSSHDQRTRK